MACSGTGVERKEETKAGKEEMRNGKEGVGKVMIGVAWL